MSNAARPLGGHKTPCLIQQSRQKRPHPRTTERARINLSLPPWQKSSVRLTRKSSLLYFVDHCRTSRLRHQHLTRTRNQRPRNPRQMPRRPTTKSLHRQLWKKLQSSRKLNSQRIRLKRDCPRAPKSASTSLPLSVRRPRRRRRSWKLRLLISGSSSKQRPPQSRMLRFGLPLTILTCTYNRRSR